MEEQRMGEAAMAAKTFIFDSLPSTFDKSFELIAEGKMAVWDSVLAKSQTHGIGQLRRPWQSPLGNLYVSFRLPPSPPFNCAAASVVAGFLCVTALRSLGWPLMMKWPNDLVLPENGNYRKTGGLLVEERGGALVAGLGINIISAPKHLRDDAAMPATFLFALGGLESLKNPETLWNAILAAILEEVKRKGRMESWHDGANELLLWRGMQVEVEDGADIVSGRLLGIAASGAALIQSGNEIREIDNGSMRPAD